MTIYVFEKKHVCNFNFCIFYNYNQIKYLFYYIISFLSKLYTAVIQIYLYNNFVSVG